MLRTWATEMGASMFLRNAWYVAARSREVERTLLARTILNEPIVLYRKRDGAAVALEDRCCHRHLPLSMGTIIDDDLRCGYHGLRFDANGVCVNIPGQSEIPTQARVSAYPLVERWQWLWIWMGDPAAHQRLAREWRSHFLCAARLCARGLQLGCCYAYANSHSISRRLQHIPSSKSG
jgi:phenylpropionate dioxygenase-like ring-hydroxylating dioxygenase large terminal subunit